jgi:hypothetical protein
MFVLEPVLTCSRPPPFACSLSISLTTIEYIYFNCCFGARYRVKYHRHD